MVSLKRYHHQFYPDTVAYEDGALTADEIKALEALGHKLDRNERAFGNMNVVTWDYATGKVEAATDPRGMAEGQVYWTGAAPSRMSRLKPLRQRWQAGQK